MVAEFLERLMERQLRNYLRGRNHGRQGRFSESISPSYLVGYAETYRPPSFTDFRRSQCPYCSQCGKHFCVCCS